LLKNKANPDLQDGNKWTALMMAARRCNDPIVTLLIEHHARLDDKNIDGSTALMYAVENGCITVTELLLKSGAATDIENKHDSTALTLAITTGSKELVQLLIKYDVNVNTSVSSGYTPIIIARQRRYSDIVEVLEAAGAGDPSIYLTEHFSSSQIQTTHKVAREKLQKPKKHDETLIDNSKEGNGGARKSLRAVSDKDIENTLDGMQVNTSDSLDQAFMELLKQCDQHMRKRHFKEALDCVSKALDIQPTGKNHDQIWHNKGYILTILDRHQDAIEAYDQALLLNPDLEESWVNKGTELSALGQYDAALDCFERAIDLNPQDSKAWFGKGVALNRVVTGFEEFDEAINCLEKAHRLGHPDAKREIAQMKHALGSTAAELGIGNVDPGIKNRLSQPGLQTNTPGNAEQEACKNCGETKDKGDWTCPHCGYTEWGPIVVSGILGGLLCTAAIFWIEPTFGKIIGGILGIAFVLSTFKAIWVALKAVRK
jgi:tetratricopeptide (TPR) repeat protein